MTANNDFELQIAKLESARNKAVDDYFSARPELERTRHEERLFEAGVQRAWSVFSK